MPLLQLIASEAIDEDYRTLAANRAQQTARHGHSAAPATQRRFRWGGVLAVLVFGALVATAAVQNSRNANVEDAGKDELIRKVQAARIELGSVEAEEARVRREISTDDATYQSVDSAADQQESISTRLGGLTGLNPVQGSGIRVTVNDPPNSDDTTQVRDSDLATMLNGLWQAGAEAIAINGQRVTAMSAPRNSGSTIRINDTSLSAPYAVTALGNPDTLSADFADSASGQEFLEVAQSLHMPLTVQNVSNVQLPAASASVARLSGIREAHPRDGEDTN
jgi:uncharacterized protein YlxW (UPF0749 family)